MKQKEIVTTLVDVFIYFVTPWVQPISIKDRVSLGMFPNRTQCRVYPSRIPNVLRFGNFLDSDPIGTRYFVVS